MSVADNGVGQAAAPSTMVSSTSSSMFRSAEHVASHGPRPHHQAGQDGRSDLVEAVLERRNDPEVAAAAAYRPEQVSVFVCAGGAQPTVGGNDVYGKQVVAREAVRSAEPPPRVRPAMPVIDTTPPVVANPKACVSRSNSAHVTPGSARAV